MRLRPAAIIDLAIKAAAVGLALYPLLDAGSSHFQGKAMGFRAAAYPLATLLVPAVWFRSGRPRPYPYLADILIVLPFAFDAAGNVFGWFAISGFDALPHFFGWLSLSGFFGLAVGPLVERRWIGFGLMVGLGATIDILWEIGEFALSRSGSSGLQLTYENTIQDLGLSLLGATAGAVLLVVAGWPKAGTPKRVFGWQTR